MSTLGKIPQYRMMRTFTRTPTINPKSTSRMTVAKNVTIQTHVSKIDFEASLGRSRNWRNMERRDTKIIAESTA